MCMGKFDIFNKFSSAVIVIDDKKEIVFKNNFFKRAFPDSETLEKFSHKFDFNVYAIESTDVSKLSPILKAIESREDFFAHVSYQTSEDRYLYYDMAVSKKGRYNIVGVGHTCARTITHIYRNTAVVQQRRNGFHATVGMFI